MFCDGGDVYFSFIWTLSCFICVSFSYRGTDVQLFLYFHCICVNNNINCSCDPFCSCSLWYTIKTNVTVLVRNSSNPWKKKENYGGTKWNIADMNSFYFLQSLLINIMISYNISIHTLFHFDSSKMSICLSSWKSVWVLLRWACLSKDCYYTIGSTVSGHDGKSCINQYFCPALSSKRVLLFKTWLPFLQNQWQGLSRLLSYSLIFLWSVSSIPPSSSPFLSLPHSERLVAPSQHI